MGRIISFMHISLDGFVASKSGALDWVTVDQELFSHISSRIAKTSTAIYGRITYQMMESYWPTAADQPNATEHDKEHSKWYEKARKVVLSDSLSDDADRLMTVVKGDLATKISELKNTEDSDILIFGSPRATHALIEQNLIDGYWLFLNPVLLGEGTPLFKNISTKTRLKLLNSNTFTNGVVELDYEVER